MKTQNREEEYTSRDYIFYEFTNSLCPECLKTVPAKVVLKDKKAFLLKYCPTHGEQLELLEELAEYHLKKRQYDKPGTRMKVHTKVEKGCPFDCGICPQHDQHGCIGLIEVTTKCNLHCPLCYADAGQGSFLSLAKIEEMMDFFQDSEGGQAEILQISGGEPTLHPDIISIIKLAKAKKFKYVMLNTNGIRIAEDEAFAKELRQFVGGFEIYLQFDGFKESTYLSLRGESLLEKKLKAVDNLARYNVPTTLVSTISNGINDEEVGQIFAFGLKQPYVRGINFQPAAFFGRTNQNEKKNRVTLSGVLKRLEQQTSGMLQVNDFIPLPCNVERVAITYLYKTSKGGFSPITREARIQDYLHLINNTFVFTIEDALKNAGKSIKDIKTTCDCFNFLNDFRHIVPFDFFIKSKEKKMEYIDQNTFRISVSSFLDAYNFDMKSMQKECVHVITPDLRKIPFSAYNTVHRGSNMNEFLRQGLFHIIIQTTICLSVFSLFLAIFIDFELYSRKEQVQKEKKSIVETGTMTFFFLIFYVILLSGVGVVSIQSGFTKGFFMILGTVMIAVGCIVNISGRFNLGRNWANQIKIYQEHSLVQTGMYKIVRHPLYASIILMFYGAVMVYRNMVALIAVSLVFVPFMYYRASQEENMLIQRFPQYVEYKQNTGMLFPKILKRKRHGG